MEVDELEGKSKNVKKIKLDFDKANTVTEVQNNETEPSTTDNESIQHSNSNKSSDSNPEESNTTEPKQNETNNTQIIVPFIKDNLDESNTEPIPQQPSTETVEKSLPMEDKELPKEPFNQENPSEIVDANRQPQGRNVFLPNGNINYNNLPNNFVSPKRLDSKNRRGSGAGINSPLDLAHYKPPLKSLEEINDPNYEKNIGFEPIPYGSNVVYEEPEILSPNLEHAIPIYNRPNINYRNNLINMTYNASNSFPGINNSPENMNDRTSPKMNDVKAQENEKKKEKKNNRKTLNFLHMLKKSKSAENMKKGRMSLFKPATKTGSVPVNKITETKKATSPPLSHTLPLNGNNFNFNIYLYF